MNSSYLSSPVLRIRGRDYYPPPLLPGYHSGSAEFVTRALNRLFEERIGMPIKVDWRGEICPEEREQLLSRMRSLSIPVQSIEFNVTDKTLQWYPPEGTEVLTQDREDGSLGIARYLGRWVPVSGPLPPGAENSV